MNNLLARATAGLRILAQVERAHATDNQRELERLLAGVDPVDLAQTANELRFLAASIPSIPRRKQGAGASPLTPAPSLRQVRCE